MREKCPHGRSVPARTPLEAKSWLPTSRRTIMRFPMGEATEARRDLNGEGKTRREETQRSFGGATLFRAWTQYKTEVL